VKADHAPDNNRIGTEGDGALENALHAYAGFPHPRGRYYLARCGRKTDLLELVGLRRMVHGGLVHGVGERYRDDVYHELSGILLVAERVFGDRFWSARGSTLKRSMGGLREATAKKLKGARLGIPSALKVEVHAIGRGTTEPIGSL
jgi:hypothetical protein